MKSVIVYASVHHGNTRKLVDALAEQFPIDTIDAVAVKEAELSGYDLVGFASGIYAGQFHQTIKEFAARNLPENKKIFFIMTSAMNKDFTKSMNASLDGKNPIIMGKYSCFGYNTFGPFKLIGGTSKGHPDKTDIENVLKFYQTFLNNV